MLEFTLQTVSVSRAPLLNLSFWACLGLPIGFAGEGPKTLTMSAVPVLAVIGGIVIGGFGRRSLSPVQLRRLLEIVLIAMGISLSGKGITDVM